MRLFSGCHHSPFFQSSVLSSSPLFLPTHISIFSVLPPISFIPPSLLSALACAAAPLRSVHHGSVLLCVFDSHLLSFLSLTGLTARPKLDWTVTHRATGENKPPVLCPPLKSQHHWIMAPQPSHAQHTHCPLRTLQPQLSLFFSPATRSHVLFDWCCVSRALYNTGFKMGPVDAQCSLHEAEWWREHGPDIQGSSMLLFPSSIFTFGYILVSGSTSSSHGYTCSHLCCPVRTRGAFNVRVHSWLLCQGPASRPQLWPCQYRCHSAVVTFPSTESCFNTKPEWWRDFLLLRLSAEQPLASVTPFRSKSCSKAFSPPAMFPNCSLI